MDANTIERLAENQIKNRKWQEYINNMSEKAYAMGKLAYITFELTPLCTLNCKMCYVHLDRETADKRGKHKTAEEWISLAKEFKDQGGFSILLTGGEAMSRPDFVTIYDELSRMGFIITVFTNGTTITDEIVELFKKRPPFLIGLTLYGASEDSYELTTGVRSYKRAMDGLDRLLSIPNINIDIRFTACNLNYKDYPILQEEIAKRGHMLSADVGDMAPVRGATSDVHSLRLTEEEAEEFHSYVGSASAPIIDAIHSISVDKKQESKTVKEKNETTGNIAPTELKADNEDFARHLNCKAAINGVYISYDGKMYPCDTFQDPYYTEPFKDGFVNALEKVRKMTKEILVPKECFSCKNINKCGPCAARLFAEKEACKRVGRPCGYEPK